MKTLLIGGTGAIGQGLIPYFKDYEVCDSKQFPLPTLPYPFIYDADVVINLAALYTDCELSKFNIVNKKLILVNCLGAVNILAAFLPRMKERGYGRIIMMSSIYSHFNVRGQGVYSASKAFVDKLVNIAALENAEFGITVNSIQLGYTGVGMGELNLERTRNKPALKRFVTMDEIYNTIDYIIKTEYITGQNIRLDGGVK
jgi:3-oxoacyl-[acyl-carrier protein] reductase